jgi:hypothetical protein
MILINIFGWGYKPTYNRGGPSCMLIFPNSHKMKLFKTTHLTLSDWPDQSQLELGEFAIGPASDSKSEIMISEGLTFTLTLRIINYYFQSQHPNVNVAIISYY